ncbi:dermonecrotic toxin domain-containing protein [Pseudomonas rossensis]|uniref:dermonecrotic toxin domain-containing protein n=1 Tax=Pseudomonas rossensis TaxID=2305471 RepID=UPI0032601628
MNSLFDAKTLIANARPSWLDGVTQNDRELYLAHEGWLVARESELKKQLGHFSSLKDYARSTANQLIKLEFDQDLDADEIVCNARYTFQVGGRKIEQEDTRTLTEQFIYGLYEEGQRAKLVFKGDGLPAELNQEWFEEMMTNDARAAYGAQFRSLYQRQEVMQALKNVMSQRLLLSALAARHQGHINDKNFAQIVSALYGDQAFTIDGVRLIDNTRALQQLILVARLDGRGDFLLYAPGSPGGQDWYESKDLPGLGMRVGGWTKDGKGRDYLTWQSHAVDREAIATYLKQVERLPRTWKGVSLVASPFKGTEVLTAIIENIRAWRVAEEESRTPYGYRTASDDQRQNFARTRCELKALQVIATREGGFIPYGKFCFDLIKQRIEQVLAERGERATVNPDRIFVSVSSQVVMTLTELISTETHFYADEKQTPWSYPRFTLEHDHPPISKLDIRDIAGWSRTLRPGEKYIEMLRSKHLNRSHPEGALKRMVHLEVQRRQMKVGVMQERFNGRLTAEQYRQLMNVIEALEKIDTRPNLMAEYPRDLRFSAMFKLHLRDKLVVGVFVFRLVIGDRIEEFLYTPDAPDGRLIRPHSEFVSAVKKLKFGNYFYDRVRYKDQRVVGTYITDLEEIDNFNEAPVLPRNSRVRDLGSSYDDLINRTISDVDEKTESLDEVIFKLVFGAVQAAAAVVSVVIPPVGIAMSVVLFSKSVLDGAEAYNDGDRATAATHFLDALIELASLGKAGYSKTQPTKLQQDFIGLLGDVYSIQKFYSQATGQQKLPLQALEAIQAILDDPQALDSKTRLL